MRSRVFRCALLVSSWLLGCEAAPLDVVSVPAPDWKTGLIAHWTFDENLGGVASDESGNGHDGQLTGGTWIDDGRFGGALRLASGDWVAVPNFPEATPSWTASAWVRLSPDQLAADSETWATFMSTEVLRSGGWELNMDRTLSEPRFVFSYWSPPPDYLITQCVCVKTDTWTHLAGVVDAETNRVQLFVNGTMVDQQPRTAAIIPGDSTLYFGRWGDEGRTLSGDIDDIAVWQRALSATEIASLADQSP